MKRHRISLLPGWKDVISKSNNGIIKNLNHQPLPKLHEYFASNLTFVNTAEGASTMLQLARQRPLSHIGFDTEFQYTRAPVIIDAKKQQFATDPRSVKPL